jgi:hypothetical protein
VIAPMRDSITMVAPHATVTAPLFPPVIGAAKLALAGSESREHVAS